MWKLLISFFFLNLALANNVDLDIVPKSIRNNPSLASFVKEYGKQKSRYKNIYYFKKDRVSIIVFIDKAKNVYKAEYQFYKSNITYSSTKEKLKDFKLSPIKGHSDGRYLIYKDKNETVRFYKNHTQSIDNYEVQWSK